MNSFGIPAILMRLVKMTMTNVTYQMKVDGKLSRPFATTKGLRQVDGLACLLFNLALERAIRDSRVKTTETIFYKSTQILAYADDIGIIGLGSHHYRLFYVAEAYQGIEQAELLKSSHNSPMSVQGSVPTIEWMSCEQGRWLSTVRSTV